MKIFPVESGLIMTNGYLLYDSQSCTGIVIDAPQNSAEIFIDFSRNNDIKIQAIILTHSHFDHTADAALLKGKTNAELYVHQSDEFRLLEPGKNLLFSLPFKLEPAIPDKYLNHLDTLQFGQIQLEVRHTPGHTGGSVCLINHEEKLIFSGDTIFNRSIGRTDLPGGSYNQIIKSIHESILSLDDDYKIYSGHGISTTVGFEKKNNPFITREPY